MLRRTLFGLLGTSVLAACDRGASSTTTTSAPTAASLAPDAPVDPQFTGCTA